MFQRPIALSIFAAAAAALAAQQADLDRDGIPDALEQELLEQFLPVFHVSPGDCDGQPVEFARNVNPPRPLTRNGTIYGRVAPSKFGTGYVEIQYFHLWSRDCGRFSHKLDVEHVAAVVVAGRPSYALYWYSGAHEGTLCDNSQWSRAQDLEAVRHGPKVWIARNKHSSYLNQRRCATGCRTDDCTDGVPIQVHRVINLGEPDAILNGSVFVKSLRWRFMAKLRRRDFDSGVFAGRAKSPQSATTQSCP